MKNSMGMATDARLALGLMTAGLLSLATFFWLGFGSIPSRSMVRETTFSHASLVDAGVEFIDVTHEVGLFDFRHATNGIHSIADTLGPGLGLLDLDDDEDLDLVLLGGPVSPTGVSIHRNLFQETGELLFEDITAAAGIVWQGSALGVCAGDFDNDDVLDLFITAFGPNLLLKGVRTENGIRYLDVTARAGVAGGEYHFVSASPGASGEVRAGPPPQASSGVTAVSVPEFSTSASFGDYDLDGDLDLYVANFVSVEPEPDNGPSREFDDRFIARRFSPQADRLYRNNGDGTFVEVTAAAGLSSRSMRTMSAAFLQIHNRAPDLYVTHEFAANALYLNQGGHPDRPPFLLADVGLDDVRSGMAILRGDVDADGDLDFLIPNGRNEPASLFLASLSSPGSFDENEILFEDRGHRYGLGDQTEAPLGRGAAFFDFDADGYQDVVVAHGLDRPIDGSLTCSPEPIYLYHNLRGAGFVDVTQGAGQPLEEKYNARGLVAGDLDLDGDLDLVIAQNNGPAVVLANALQRRKSLRLNLRLRGVRRDAIGTHVEVICAGVQQTREIISGGSYLSQPPFMLFFGADDASQVDKLKIKYPPPYKDSEQSPDFVGFDMRLGPDTGSVR